MGENCRGVISGVNRTTVSVETMPSIHHALVNRLVCPRKPYVKLRNITARMIGPHVAACPPIEANELPAGASMPSA